MRRRTEEEQQEWEANYFAMHLLVPSPLLQKDLAIIENIDIENDPRIIELAKKYQVSLQVMYFRVFEELNKSWDVHNAIP